MSEHFAEARRAMTALLAERGVRDARLLEAMGRLERHLFVDGPMMSRAYEDRALPIGQGQTISQPWIVALMTQALKLEGGERVLEVGTGSGYQAALLALLGARVYTIERHSELLARARRVFEELGLEIVSRRGDGSIGWSAEAPFDRIIVTAGAPRVPEALARQLSVGGRLVLPVGDRREQQLRIVDRLSESAFRGRAAEACAFVPLLGREGWPVDPA